MPKPHWSAGHFHAVWPVRGKVINRGPSEIKLADDHSQLFIFDMYLAIIVVVTMGIYLMLDTDNWRHPALMGAPTQPDTLREGLRCNHN